MTEREDETREPGSELGAETPEEAAQFADVAAALGLATDPVAPPASLKASIMSKLATTPQLPSLDETPTPETDVPESTPRHRDQPAEAAPETPIGPAETRARSRWFARPAAMIAAAAVVVAIGLGGTALGITLSNVHPPTQEQASGVSQITDAKDAQRATAKIPTGGTATLIWSSALEKSAMIIDGLAAAPAGKTYEMWYLRGDKAIPAGTVNLAAGGSAAHVLKGSMATGDAVAVTVEPRGGSKQPTSTPILSIQS